MVRIYQLDIDKIFDFGTPERNTREMAFMSYDRWLANSIIPHASMYRKVWEGECTNNLDDIFIIFNVNIPIDFKGHSLSVSDVIVTDNGAFFVDIFGFKPVNWFENEECWLNISGYHLYVQDSSEGGVDWTLYDCNMKEIDGGIYESENYSEAVYSVIADYICKSLDGECPCVELEEEPEARCV